MLKRLLSILPLLLAWAHIDPTLAQDALVVSSCGTLGQPYVAGSTRLPTVDTTGHLCGSGGGGGGSPGGAPNSVQFNSGGSAFGGITNLTTNGTNPLLTAIAAPGSPAAGTGVFYEDSTNLIFSFKNAAGTVSSTVVPSTAPANQFATAISVAGVVSYAQPAFTNISGQTTLAQLPSIANNTALGNVSGGTSTPVALTTTQLTTLVNVFTSTLSGAAPASGGGTTNFLRADGTWTAPGGGGGTPGGANTNVQFNNSGAFGGDSGFTYTTPGQVTIALGSIAANAKALNITGTWNNAAVTFDAPLFMNITNTASAAGSLLADFQVGGTSQFNIDKGGNSTFLGQLQFRPSGGDQWNNAALTSSEDIVWFNNSTSKGAFAVHADSGSISGAFVAASGNFGWQNGGNAWGGTIDLVLNRDAAGILAQKNSTTAQTFRVYNTFTDASNYERAVMDWTTSANVLTMGSQAAGTGSLRQVYINFTTQGGFSDTGTLFFVVRPISNIVSIRSNSAYAWSDSSSDAVGTANFPTSLVQLSVGTIGFLGLSGAGGTFSGKSLTPSTLASGTTNNYDPGGKSYFYRLTANAANSVLTGLAPNTAAQQDGEVHVIINLAAAGTLTLNHQDAGSTAANRFLNSTGLNIVLSPNQAADVIYDATVSRWLVFKRH